MIVRTVGQDLWLFDQHDHAALCGVMAEAWGVPPFAGVPEPVRQAAALHDSGWREWDPLPRLDPTTGHPHPYSHMPPQDYLEIWERSLRRAWEEDALVGLMVSLHGMRFFASRQRPAERELLAAERARQAEALRRLGAKGSDPEALPEPYATWHAWFFFWDALSLFFCEGWTSPWTRAIPLADAGESEVRVERRAEGQSDGEVTVAPFPFPRALALEVPLRVLPSRAYDTQQALDAGMRTAERRILRWTLSPGEG